MKRNDGFTLVEMMVSIIAGTIATAAVATMLLLGIRMNAKTSEIATRDNQILIGLTVLSDLSKENEIVLEHEADKEVSDDYNEDSWTVKSDDEELFSFDPENNAVVVGGNALITDVTHASIEGPDLDNGLLKITLVVDGEKYPLTVRCRTGQTVTMPTEETLTENP